MRQAQINVRTRACSRTSIARTKQAALTHNVRGKELNSKKILPHSFGCDSHIKCKWQRAFLNKLPTQISMNNRKCITWELKKKFLALQPSAGTMGIKSRIVNIIYYRKTMTH